ncbi:hypothetical protein D3C79_1026560 [compost metagenome]
MLFAPLFFQWQQGLGNEAANAVGKGGNVIIEPGRTVVVQHGDYLKGFVGELPGCASNTSVDGAMTGMGMRLDGAVTTATDQGLAGNIIGFRQA